MPRPTRWVGAKNAVLTATGTVRTVLDILGAGTLDKGETITRIRGSVVFQRNVTATTFDRVAVGIRLIDGGVSALNSGDPQDDYGAPWIWRYATVFTVGDASANVYSGFRIDIDAKAQRIVRDASQVLRCQVHTEQPALVGVDCRVLVKTV